MMPELANDGVMIVGDAAGLCLNLGYTVRGMDLAIASAQAAAQTAIDAKARQDFSAASLAGYKRALEKNGVLRDMRHFRKLPGLMENPRLFTEYPRMAANIVVICSPLMAVQSHRCVKLSCHMRKKLDW